MSIRRSARRALLSVLEVADNTIVEYVVRKPTPTDLIMYMSISVVFGVICTLLADAFTFDPLVLIGWGIIAASPTVPFLAYVSDALIKLTHRSRAFGDTEISSVLYWRISDVLEERGITNAKRYISEHPDHSNALLQTIVDLYSVHLGDWDSIVALVYLTHENPAETGRTIVELVEERGDMPASDYKALLTIRKTTAAPLTEGAL